MVTRRGERRSHRRMRGARRAPVRSASPRGSRGTRGDTGEGTAARSARSPVHCRPTGWGPGPAPARLRRSRACTGLAWRGAAYASRPPGRPRHRSAPRRSGGPGRRSVPAARPLRAGCGRGTVRRRRSRRAGVREETEAAGREIGENRRDERGGPPGAEVLPALTPGAPPPRRAVRTAARRDGGHGVARGRAHRCPARRRGAPGERPETAERAVRFPKKTHIR